jgi:Fic family protein
LNKKKQALQTSRPFPNNALNKIAESLAIEWTCNSNSIEGNSLSLGETQMVIQEAITIKGKSLREHFETHNHDKAIDCLFSIVSVQYVLRSIDILSLHGLVLRSIEEDFVGRLPNARVRITGANFVPLNANKVSDLLDELIDFINTNPLQLNDIELGAVFHHKLVWIHPFFDGNGRKVPLIMNLLLLRSGFPAAIILKNDRKKYYEALNQANGENYHKLTLMMCQAFERTLNIYINALAGNHTEYIAISNLVQEPNMP